MLMYFLRVAPALLSSWAKAPPGKPNAAPGHHLQPGQAQGQILPGLQPEGADVMLTSKPQENVKQSFCPYQKAPLSLSRKTPNP
ncbi:unnamed protein product [Prunus armeniaca]